MNKPAIRKLLTGSSLLLAFLFCHLSTTAQEFGGNPPSVKWRQINTSLARLIFPEGLDSFARDVNSIIHRIQVANPNTLGPTFKKIDIVLQNQPTYSNGYVGLGPFRSEFYLTPRQNSFELGSLPWHKKLALHEYRHVQQFSNFRKGWSRVAYYVFGQEGQALANNAAVPDWFWEGDAVYQETVLSEQGRGRMPYFFNGYRSLWSSQKNYSWMKLRNGSYRDLVPDHYQLGYLLVNYGYHKFGAATWGKIAEDAAAFKGIFYPFQKAFKRHSGISLADFSREAMQWYRKNEIPSNDSAAAYGSHQRHFTGDQVYPQWLNDNEIVYLESSFSRIPAFYVMNVSTQQTRKISLKGISSSTYFSAAGNKIVYSSFIPDPRWSWKNYEVITVVDIATGKEKRITPKTRYLSPALSPDGVRIVAVDVQTSGRNALHVIDASTGRVLNEVPAQQGIVYTHPVFFSHDTLLSAIRNPSGEMALAKVSIGDGKIVTITPYSMDVIAYPRIYRDTIYFSKSYGNQDKLFALIGGQQREFVPAYTNNSTGNYMLDGRNGRYAWSAFTSAGMRLFLGQGKFQEVANSNGSIYPVHAPATFANLAQPAKSENAITTAYSKAFQLFNFHSWRPYFSDPDYSYSLISNNILNTFQTELYFNYNRNERFKETGASLAYGAFYPVLTGGASFTFDRSFYDTAGQITWNEFNGRIGAYVPWQFNSGSFSQALTVGSYFNTKQVYYTGASKEAFDTKRFNYAEFTIGFSNQQLRARQNIYPRIAQSFSARYRRIINNYSANQLLLNTSFYFPGLLRNHNLVVQLAYQRRDTMQQYVFPNSFPISRGYPDIDYPRMWKAGFNYHMPLFYPDAGFANIVYLLRVRSNVYYDFSRVKSLRSGRTFFLDAAGAELYFDTRWWNQLPVSFGIRYSRLLDADAVGISPNQWELVLPVNIFSR